MATLIIEDKIDRVIAQMQSELKSTTGVVKEELQYKIKLAESYRDRHRLDLKMKEIADERMRDPELYQRMMKELVKDIPGVSYNKRDDNFCVRPTVQGKRVYLGIFKKVSEAVDMLEYYFKLNKVSY